MKKKACSVTLCGSTLEDETDSTQMGDLGGILYDISLHEYTLKLAGMTKNATNHSGAGCHSLLGT